MTTLMASLALALGGASLDVESIKLARTFEVGETQVYAVTAKMDADGSILDLKANVTFKIKKKTDDGGQVSMSVTDFSSTMNGDNMGESGPEEIVSDVQASGWPQVMSTEGFAWIYILAAAAGIVPDKEVEVGKSFTIDWAAKDKTSTAKGTGKVAEFVEKEGKKAVKIEYDVAVSPSDPNPGQVKCTTFVDRLTAAPIACEGTVTVEGGEIKFTVKRLK